MLLPSPQGLFLRAVVVDYHPYTFLRDKRRPDLAFGLCIDLLRHMASELNFTYEQQIQMTESAMGEDLYEFYMDDYFPVDGQGFGEQGNDNNHHFTVEIHSNTVQLALP